MTTRRKSRLPAAIAFALSFGFHVVMLAVILSQISPVYDLPVVAPPPMDVRIITLPEQEPPPPVITPPVPPREPLKPPEPTRPPPTPEPPKPAPPKPVAPAPAPPQPPSPSPPRVAPAPTPVAPKPAPPQPTPPKPTPPVLRPQPTPTAAPPVPTPPAPHPIVAPPARSPPSAAPAPTPPMHLNIHKPEKDAPTSVPTLPFAPAPGRASSSGSPATASPSQAGEPALGGSRLTGLTPYPYGAMPNGGGGLRGSLVGCANPDAVGLSEAERNRCNARFGASAGSAPVFDSMSPARRAAFDKAAAGQEADRKYRSGMPTGTTAGKPGFGSGLGDDQPTPLRDRLNPQP